MKTDYRLRTGSFAAVLASIVLHGWGKNYSPLLWILVVLQLLVYPHLVFWLAKRSRSPRRAEMINLGIDCALFGILVTVLQFPLWISFTVYLASTVNLILYRGVSGLVQSQVFFFTGALLSVVAFGWHVSPQTDWPATAICLVGLMLYMPSIALAAHARNQKLRKAREALRRGEKALKRQLAKIQSLQHQLQEQATQDSLTGLHNRRFLDLIEVRELARCKREGTYLTAIMIDVDHFKAVNDTYGHPGGDEVLKKLAAMLLDKARASDVACRYGGEEFLLLLPNMPPDIALARANEWRMAFAREVTQFGDMRMQATISMGIASFPVHGHTFAELIRCADIALYDAKQTGRNRAVLYRPDMAATGNG